MALLTLMQGPPLTYNKDNQEDKEPLFDSVCTLRIMADMVGGTLDSATEVRTGSMQVKPEATRRAAQKGNATATDLADYPVRRGLPFRDAHEVVAHAAKAAMQQGLDLAELPLATLQGFHAAIDSDVVDVLSLEGSLNARKVPGGAASEHLRRQVERHRQRPG